MPDSSRYKIYNPKAADRLGVVFTPNEIVRFMLESADYLVYKYFGKLLADPHVEILDPATGTGTFITELIEYLLTILKPIYRDIKSGGTRKYSEGVSIRRCHERVLTWRYENQARSCRFSDVKKR
ncbi:adenine specific DNA methyltransferase [Candidatus Vecturithrix granuli]|uniref:Adenine specific DNA methyltransferase n=1 Tax=Vecturithrix granuli TaxID=1499967 RepID=A0A081C051_VECG1|nr:adenine specific DNA methyltransferase [Candidatus Vecturithrix granuli]